MKKVFWQIVLSAAFVSVLCMSAFSQDVESAGDGLDSLFDTAVDVDPVVKAPPLQQTEEKKKGITFTGINDTRLGGYIWFYPRANEPGAVFQNKLGFISNTSDGWFHMEGSLLTEFPDMKIGLYELFFNYTPYGRLTISAGQRNLSWGFDSILDTNILDDQSDTVIDPEKVLNKDSYELEKSKFTVAVIVPFPPYVTFTGLVFYKNYLNNGKYTPDDLSYAGRVETKIGRFAVTVFGRSWAYNDNSGYDPAVGLEFQGTPVDSDIFKSQFFFQGSFNINSKGDNFSTTRMKFHGGVYEYIKEPVRLGARLEYQYIYNEPLPRGTSPHTEKHYWSGELGWKHFIGDTGRDLGLAVKWFHDRYEDYGLITPGVSVANIMKYADFSIGFPIYYGKIEKYGFVCELKLSVTY